MEKIKLGDVCKIQSGYAFKSNEFQKGNIPIIRIGNIQDNNIEIDENVCYKEEFLNEHPEFEIKYGDILIAMSGATVGKIGKYQNNCKALLNQRVGKFIASKKLEKRYLYFLLCSPVFEKFILNNAFGCAQPNISAKKIEEFEFYNYDNVKQLEIANELDKVQEIIDIRKEQIEYLDELIKSQFVEMFGDVINNQKHFKYKRIDEISEIVTGTTPNTNDYKNWNGNIKWITPAEIDKNTFIVNDTERKITEEGRKSKSLTIMPKGTVLFTTRAPIGKTAIAGDEMCCNQGFKNCICKKDINNIYLYFVLKYNANYFDCLGTGATFRELSKTNFSKIKIAVPPIDLQNKFADFVKQIDKQKFEIQKSLKKIERLKESLMNKYFG